MELYRYISVVISIALLLILASQAKNKGANKTLIGFSIAYGLFTLGLGISNISTAGAINALLVFESGRASMDQGAFDALHKTLDTHFTSGYIHAVAGSILAALGFVSMHKG